MTKQRMCGLVPLGDPPPFPPAPQRPPQRLPPSPAPQRPLRIDEVRQRELEEIDHQIALAKKRAELQAATVDVRIPTSAHKLNADQTVAVATDVFWNEDMTTCPRGAKVQLLGAGGVAVYGDYHGDPFWQAWCPLPKRRRK